MIALRPATLETVRPLRLRALREDPDAFGSTLESEQDRPDADWDFWVRDSIIAFDGDTPVGMANLKLEPDQARLFGMWVAPEARGQGLGRLLLAAALHYFLESGMTRARVVTQARNIASQRLYQGCGFLIESAALWYHRWCRAAEIRSE